MRLRPTPSTPANISAVWYEFCVMLGHSQQPASPQMSRVRMLGIVWRTTYSTTANMQTTRPLQ